MDESRRQFLKYLLYGGGSILIFPFKNIFPKKNEAEIKIPDLVGVKGGEPSQMFKAGIKALGGMERFVKKGQTVLVKPNIAWNKTPLEGANTNPDLVSAIIEEVYRVGASKVYVFDNTCNLMEESYKNSGIKAATEKSKGILKPGDKEKYYIEKKSDKLKNLKKVKIHELYLNSDVVINVPILKTHGSARVTACLKNLMGVVWDRSDWHRKDLHSCISEFPLYRKPDLNIIDAYLVMKQNGPRGISPDDLVIKKMQLLSTDMVLADAAASRILDFKEEDIRYIKLAAGLGIGSMDLKGKNIKRISLS